MRQGAGNILTETLPVTCLEAMSLAPKILSGSTVIACATAAWAADFPEPLTDTDFVQSNMSEVRLGQALFYDPILSGNRNVSCATCHHPRFATGDGLSLGLGDGGIGLGPERVADPDNLPEQRIPRNSPALFNLGLKQLRVLFHDGRIEVDPSRANGFRTPLEDEMVSGFSGLLSAQTMFPVLSADEMAGHYQKNEISKLVRQGRITGPGGAWDAIAARVAKIDEYQSEFEMVYPDIARGRAVGFADISNAIAAFMAFEWRADNSAFDQMLRGEISLPDLAAEGASLFYGKAQCAACHSGQMLSDQGFHAMGQPQLGPGKAARFEAHQKDIGRARVTGRFEDFYAFRTPPLRNVAKTGPWGHAGAFANLPDFLRHHADPVSRLSTYQVQVALPPLEGAKPDWTILGDEAAMAEIKDAVIQPPVRLSDDEFEALLAFLDSLTDPTSLAGRLGIPDSVPSGLPVER